MNILPKILIIDDEPSAISVLYHALNGMGDVRYATNGAEGLALMEENPAVLVLLDANMPGMDGFATCQALKKNFPDTAVIFVTAANDPASELRALASGAEDFISKPINSLIVRARVNIHLQNREYAARLRRSEIRYRTLFEESPLGYSLNYLDEGNFLQVNNALAALLGYSKNELLELTDINLTPPDFHYEENYQQQTLREMGRCGPYKKEYLHREKTKILVQITRVLIVEEDYTPLVLSVIENLVT